MIAAAGSGQRLAAGGPKAFVELAARPLLAHALAAIAASERVGSVVIAAPESHRDAAEAELERSGCAGVVVPGGATRPASVSRALEVVETPVVVVHDAARPLAPAALFDRLVERLRQRPDCAAAIAAEPLADTVKRSRDPHGPEGELPGVVAATEDRDLLWAAQTPQAFRTDALRAAQQQAAADGRLDAATDEARLIELAGGTVLLEPTGVPNLKVTTAADLRLAAKLLANQ